RPARRPALLHPRGRPRRRRRRPGPPPDRPPRGRGRWPPPPRHHPGIARLRARAVGVEDRSGRLRLNAKPQAAKTTGSATMLTSRAWWFLLTVFVVLLGGILLQFVPVTLLGLTLLLWFCWEWLAFAVRSRTVLRRLRVEREVADERGPVATLWAGRTFRVRVRLVGYGLPFVAVTDLVPF